jgi:Ubiquitin interaction motif
MYQTLHEEEALQAALSESLHLYHSLQEEEDLALAIQMSLVNEAERKLDCSESSRIPGYLLLTRFLF